MSAYTQLRQKLEEAIDCEMRMLLEPQSTEASEVLIEVFLKTQELQDLLARWRMLYLLQEPGH